MVDVVVDQKSMPKLPYDPEVIPKAVRDRAAAVDALYAHADTSGESPQTQPSSEVKPPELPSPPETPVAEQVPVVPPSTTTPAPSAPAVSPPPPPEDENSDSWKLKFVRMQGQNTALNKTIGEMQVQLEQLGSELLHLQHNQQQAPRAPRERQPGAAVTPPPQYLTPEDEQNYGRDLLDMSKRAAMEMVAPKIQEIEEQNALLRRQVADERRRSLDQMVEQAVPDFREIDRNPRWHRWLLGIDVLSGRVRQTLLNDAIATASAHRVISFFNGFKQEEAATGHIEAPASTPTGQAPPREAAVPLASLAAPGRARPATGGDTSLPTEKPIYSRAQIKQLYDAHRKGAYVGREAEWARQDAEIIAAGREGRIR